MNRHSIGIALTTTAVGVLIALPMGVRLDRIGDRLTSVTNGGDERQGRIGLECLVHQQFALDRQGSEQEVVTRVSLADGESIQVMVRRLVDSLPLGAYGSRGEVPRRDLRSELEAGSLQTRWRAVGGKSIVVVCRLLPTESIEELLARNSTAIGELELYFPPILAEPLESVDSAAGRALKVGIRKQLEDQQER